MFQGVSVPNSPLKIPALMSKPPTPDPQKIFALLTSRGTDSPRPIKLCARTGFSVILSNCAAFIVTACHRDAVARSTPLPRDL